MRKSRKCKDCGQPLDDECWGCHEDVLAIKAGLLDEPLPTKFCGKEGNSVSQIIRKEKEKVR
jgi:hypothetical protein